MADTKETKAFDDLDSLAFEIYSARLAHPQQRGGEHVAIDSYRQAETFLSVRDRARGGKLKAKADDGSTLADCSAPNLRQTHPHNLVSQRFGDLVKVNRIKAWLDKNPTPESAPEELVGRINREFPELSWDLPTVNTARAIFPAYAA
jgi:hypothetical protein